MTIKEACDLLKEELLDNGYEYGFYLNGVTYKSCYGKEIVFESEQSFIDGYKEDGYEVIDVTDSVIVGEAPDFVLSRMD